MVGLLILITGVFLASTGSFAGKADKCSPWPECKDDGGEPPTGCTDIFPAFSYVQPGTRRIPEETRLASSEGCRTEPVLVPGQSTTMHMTANRKAGVFVWAEETGNSGQYIVRRLDYTVDFTVNPSGKLILEEAVTILPLAGEEPGAGESQYFQVSDVWGDANHDSLYLAVTHLRDFSTGDYAGSSTRQVLIYDLNDLTDNSALPEPDKRTIYQQWNSPSEWSNPDNPPETAQWLNADPDALTLQECESVPYPQFAPICYKADNITFNSSGTRLYLDQGLRHYLEDGEVNLWHSTMRININRLDAAGEELPLANWSISGPEMVTAIDFRGSHGPHEAVPRPDANPYTLPNPEILATQGGYFINADQCVGEYADYADGNNGVADNHWESCTRQDLFANGIGARSWDSPDSYLFSRFAQQGKNNREIYRIHVLVESGMAGNEELLIVNGEGPDTGL